MRGEAGTARISGPVPVESNGSQQFPVIRLDGVTLISDKGLGVVFHLALAWLPPRNPQVSEEITFLETRDSLVLFRVEVAGVG